MHIYFYSCCCLYFDCYNRLFIRQSYINTIAKWYDKQSIRWSTLQQKLKLPMRQIYRKHLKSVVFTDGFFTEIKFVSKLVVDKFNDGSFESVDNYRQLYPSVNLSINRQILILL